MQLLFPYLSLPVLLVLLQMLLLLQSAGGGRTHIGKPCCHSRQSARRSRPACLKRLYVYGVRMRRPCARGAWEDIDRCAFAKLVAAVAGVIVTIPVNSPATSDITAAVECGGCAGRRVGRRGCVRGVGNVIQRLATYVTCSGNCTGITAAATRILQVRTRKHRRGAGRRHCRCSCRSRSSGDGSGGRPGRRVDGCGSGSSGTTVIRSRLLYERQSA